MGTLGLTLRRNRRQHGPGVYYKALRMAERRVRRALEDPRERVRAQEAVLRAAQRVRSLLGAGFFVPLATCWLAALARIHFLLDQEDDDDDLGVAVEKSTLRAADVQYSSGDDDSSREEESRPVFVIDRPQIERRPPATKPAKKRRRRVLPG